MSEQVSLPQFIFDLLSNLFSYYEHAHCQIFVPLQRSQVMITRKETMAGKHKMHSIFLTPNLHSSLGI